LSSPRGSAREGQQGKERGFFYLRCGGKEAGLTMLVTFPWKKKGDPTIEEK